LIKNKCEDLCRGVTSVLGKEMEKYCRAKANLEDHMLRAKTLKDNLQVLDQESPTELLLNVIQREENIKNVIKVPDD
jgi:hypothetical protein